MGKMVRLDKFLADTGAGTRSEVKKMIQKGNVSINGVIVKKPEQKVDAENDQIMLNGELLGSLSEFEYYLLHKPAGCVSATEDRIDETVMKYVPSSRKGLFPVGRLDKDTEGLLLITNDGVLAHELLSPKKHVEKTYYAKVEGIVTEEDVEAMKNGVDIGEEKPTLPAKLVIQSVDEASGLSEIFLTICEGKFHQVKRMMEAVGKKVIYLKRLSMGPLHLPKNLEKGECRPLTEDEVALLKKNWKTLEK